MPFPVSVTRATQTSLSTPSRAARVQFHLLFAEFDGVVQQVDQHLIELSCIMQWCRQIAGRINHLSLSWRAVQGL